MAQLENPIVDKFRDPTPEEAKAALANDMIWGDEAALRLVCSDALAAESWANTRAWVANWDAASILYQSPFSSQYWEGTQVPRSSVPLFTVATAVNSLNPQIMKGIFSGPDWFKIEARPGTRVQAARAVGSLIRYQMEDIGFAEEVRLGSMNAVLFGTAIFKWGWETFTRERTVYKRKNPPVVLKNPLGADTGAAPITIPETDEDIEEEVITEYIDRPSFEHIVNLREIMPAPGLNVADLSKARFVVHRQYLTWEDLDKLRDRPGFDIPSRQKLLELFFSPKEEAIASPQELGTRNALWDVRAQPRWMEETKDPFQQPLEVLTRWDNGTMIMVLQKKAVIANTANEYGVIPFLSVGWWDIPEAFWSMGLGKTIGSEQRLQQGITNLWLDNATLNLNGVYTRVKGKTIPTQSIRIAPGKIVEMDEKGAFDVLQRLPAVPEAGQHLALSQQRAEQVSGSSDMGTQGVAGASGHSNAARSATGVNIMAGGAGSRIEEFVDKLCRQVIVRFLYQVHEMNRAMLPVSTIRHILNEELQDAYLKDDKGDTVEFLNARVKFDILAGTKMAAKRTMGQSMPVITQFLTNQQIESQLSIQGKKLDIDEVLRVMFELADFPAYNGFIVQMTPEDQKRWQSMQPGQQVQAQTQAKSALLQQEYDRKEQIANEENIARAARDVMRQEFEKNSEPLAETGVPGATTGIGASGV